MSVNQDPVGVLTLEDNLHPSNTMSGIKSPQFKAPICTCLPPLDPNADISSPNPTPGPASPSVLDRLGSSSTDLLRQVLEEYVIQCEPDNFYATTMKRYWRMLFIMVFPTLNRVIRYMVFKVPDAMTYKVTGKDSNHLRFTLTNNAFVEDVDSSEKTKLPETVLLLPSLVSLLMEQAETGSWSCFYAHTAIGDDVVCLLHNTEEVNDDKKTVLYLHGTGCDLGMVTTSIMGVLCDVIAGYNICAIDYPGFGCSTGSLGETNSLYAIEAVLDTLLTLKQIASTSIVILATSLGTASAVHAATKYKLKGLILLGPFESILRIVWPNTKTTWSQDVLCSIDIIDEVECPLMIMHGLKDPLVDPLHGFHLHQKASSRINFFIMVSKGYHCLEGYPHVYKTVIEFLNFLDKKPSCFDYKREQ